MCGRFVITGGTRLLRRFQEEYGVEVAASENLEKVLPPGGAAYLPFRDVPVIHAADGGVRARPMYWQLIHPWNREFKSSYTQFNTRRESLSKRHNRELLAHRRCVIPASRFFETRRRGGGGDTGRESYAFALGESELVPLGGIYSVWVNPGDESDRRYSCSIITVPANELVAAVHDRMPFILPPAAVKQWLDPAETDFSRLLALVEPFPATAMVRRHEAPAQGGLF